MSDKPPSAPWRLHCTALALLIAAAAVGAAPAGAAPAYTLTATVPLAAPDWWDYVTFDPASGRVFIAHGNRLSVVDGRAGALVGTVDGIPGGTHGIAIPVKSDQGVTDDGAAGLAVAFDLKTLKVTATLKAAADADAIALDRGTGHAFVISGDPGIITVIDPVAFAVVGAIQTGEKLEFGVGDGAGSIFVAGVEKSDLLKIDARSNTVSARWPTPDCQRPHGVAVDVATRRVFMGCVNAVMMVLDADTGRIVAKLPIGQGSDAIAWDPKRKRMFSPNGRDGTMSVYQQVSADSYKALEPIQTAISGRTMALDPDSGRLFVAAAQTDPSATPGGRPKTRAGSLALMIFDPVN